MGLDRNQAIIDLENVLACYCGNALTSFGLTENRKQNSKAVSYGFFIKEAATQTAKMKRDCFALKNNLIVTEQDGLIIYESK